MKSLFKLLPIVLILGLGLNSCKKEKDTKKCDSCSISGTVVYLPIGCVGNSTTLGILDEDGNYYFVKKDLTSKFGNYMEGANICFDFNVQENCNIILHAGIMAIPIKCISLTCIGNCKPSYKDCEKSKYIESQDFYKLPETEFYSAQNMKIVGNNLKFTVGFSGCDDQVEPTLYINSPPLGAPFTILNCKLIFNRIPQACEAAFRKELCYDLGDLLEQNPKDINIITANGQVTLNLW